MNKCTCIALLACFFCLPYGTSAQKNTGITNGSLYFNLGVGVERIGTWPNNSVPLSKYYGEDTKVPLTSATLDIALTDYITVAPFFGYAYTGQNQVFPSTDGYHDWYRHYLVGSKDAVHFPIGGHFTGYIGATLGVQWSKEKLDYYHNFNNPPNTTYYNERHLFYDFFAGGKFHINARTAVFAEVGYGITWGNVGASIKLK